MIAWPRTIRGRLTVAYALAFSIGLVAFAAISYGSLDTALNAVVDERLQTARAAIADILARNAQSDKVTRERINLVVGSNRTAAVLAPGGRAVYSTAGGISRAMRAAVAQAGERPRLSTLRIKSFGVRIMTQRIRTPDGRIFSIGIARRLDLVQSLEHLAVIVLGAAVVIIGAAAVLVGSIVARQGLKPLRAVAALASEIEAHDLSRRLAVQSDTSELGQLATTFDRMLARLEDAFERQRRFTADASHELRAPLSVVHVAADLALRREREPSEYKRVLASILRATQQLEDVTDQLLLAARADAGHLSLERVDLSELAAEAVEHLMPLAQAKQVRSIARLESRAFVHAEPSGLTRAIVAVLDNAIKYSPVGGSVFVSTLAEPARVRLTFEDQGPGFSAEGLLHATDRFWRSDTVRAPGSGTGLGLAISDTVVRASGGALKLHNAADGGALVTIEFAAAGESPA